MRVHTTARFGAPLALDDELVAKAQAFTGLKEKSALVREALKTLIERESARRLARLGGSEASLHAPSARRPTRNEARQYREDPTP